MKTKLIFLITLISTVSFVAKGQLQGSETSENHSLYKGTFVVNGDKDTFYPVIFKYGNQDRINHLRIFRAYYEAGPNELSPTHKGGLTLEIDLNYGNWGGSTYNWRISDLRQTYHETFADATHSMHCMGFTIWLRGGGFVYHYESDYPSSLQVAYNNDIIYNSSDPNHPEYTVKAGNPTTTINRDNINNHLLTPSFIKQGNDILYTQGNILIGKTSQANPAYKLDVAGKVRADEITVNTSGADFVFEKGYNLRPLNEVEVFVKENKHLPDVAPATEMQTNGVSIGEMNAKLLQKVEELTLYVIELNKANRRCNEKIKQLRLHLNKVSKRRN
ncbi:hypothetical protein [uncultured Acetobacteroides sp.]|uniref:hypothetical protein n=1 Tax=uncultured Acetobacteroides sp. TaxID=1760811 RepID=UPI0029F48E7A|nr:hypothetical protein [uncultured Acetobacteroides sp.]